MGEKTNQSMQVWQLIEKLESSYCHPKLFECGELIQAVTNQEAREIVSPMSFNKALIVSVMSTKIEDILQLTYILQLTSYCDKTAYVNYEPELFRFESLAANVSRRPKLKDCPKVTP